MKTAQKVIDNLDSFRGIDDILNFVPMTSLEAVRVDQPEFRRRCDYISDGDCRRRPGHSYAHGWIVGQLGHCR